MMTLRGHTQSTDYEPNATTEKGDFLFDALRVGRPDLRASPSPNNLTAPQS